MSERAWHNVWPESILLSGGHTYLTIITKCHTRVYVPQLTPFLQHFQ